MLQGKGKNLKSVGLSFQKNLCCLLGWKPYKNDEKYFLFQLKSSFRSQRYKSFCHDILVRYEKRLD